MSTAQREIIRQEPTHPGMAITEDDRWLGRWVINMGAPISLAEHSGSRFIGKFDNDVLPAKRPVLFAPHMARAVGPYEHFMRPGDMSSAVDGMMSVPVNGPQIGSIDLSHQAPLSRYDNNPKFCTYLLMRDYERRGLVLFEESRGLSEEDFSELYNIVIPPEIEAEWAKTKRVVLDHEFRGPFLDQYKAFLAAPRRVRPVDWDQWDRVKKDRLSAMTRNLKAGVDLAWMHFSGAIADTEQEILKYRNGHKGKRGYDMPDERMSNPVPPLDLIALADLNRTPMDLKVVEASNTASAQTQQAVVDGMRAVAEELGKKIGPTITMADVESLLQQRDAQWEERLAALKDEAPKASVS